MMEPNSLGPIASIAVTITVPLMMGAVIYWWLMRRIEKRIRKELGYVDRLHDLNMRLIGMEAKMATKEELATGMNALKTDLLKVIKNADGNAHR